MDIKEDGREEDSIKAQDIKREGAEGFAASEILGELFKNDEDIEVNNDGEGTDALLENCDADAEAIAAENGADNEDTQNGESVDDIDTEIEYENAAHSSSDGEAEDGQISIELDTDGISEATDAEPSLDTVGIDNASESLDKADEAEKPDNGTAEEYNSAATEEAIPSPSDISEEENEESADKDHHELIDEVFERERFYHEAVDFDHTERLNPTPTLELTEATVGKEDSSEQLSIFDIKAQAGEPKGKKLMGNIFDFLELFVFTLAVVVLLLSFFFRHSVVDGDSMLGTLHNGEHLIISDLFYTPERGDIVVFEDHSTGFKKPLIKRVIGVGGDEIRISGKKVYLNGELLEEDYVYVDGYYSDVSITLVVPEGELFVMGDHRNESSDSRMFGTISEDSVIGRVVLRFYPFDKFGGVD